METSAPLINAIEHSNSLTHQTDAASNRSHTALFRLDALALSVIATATWLAGWVAGWLAGCLSQPVLYQND